MAPEHDLIPLEDALRIYHIVVFGVPLRVILCMIIFGLAVLCAADAMQASYQRANGPDTSAEEVADVLNQLVLGGTEEGTICRLLEYGGRLDLISGGLGQPSPADPPEYDDARVVEIRSQRTGKMLSKRLYLYFRDGSLMYKCLWSGDDKPLDVFRTEVLTGRQHPVFLKDLMSRVRWSQPTEAHRSPRDRKPASMLAKVNLPRLRCGIVMDDVTWFARTYGYNYLALLENTGPMELNEDMILFGFPVGPVVLLTGKLKNSDTTSGWPLPLALYGTRLTKVESTDKEASRIGRLRLAVGHAMFFWFRVPHVEQLQSLRAEIHGLISVNGDEWRRWDVESAQLVP
jgi:hypothetical protein